MIGIGAVQSIMIIPLGTFIWLTVIAATTAVVALVIVCVLSLLSNKPVNNLTIQPFNYLSV